MTLMREIDWESCLLEPRRDPKFERRFRAIEERFTAQGRALDTATIEEMEAAWQAVKASEG